MTSNTGLQNMTMTYRCNLLALFATVPLLAACPVDGDLGDEGNGEADEAGEAGNGSEAGDADASQGDGGDGGVTQGNSGTSGSDDGQVSESEGGTDTGVVTETGDSGGEPCDTEEECGPAPGAPNFLCDDGVTTGGPGPCQELEGGGCGYPIVECPACCYGSEVPQCFEGASCCADGTWACNDGGGGSGCESGEGIECNCCDPAQADAMGCIEGASCCADGTWACNDGDGGSSCEADGAVCSGGGNVCEDDGASCAGGETCCDGLMCCTGLPVPVGEEYCSAQCPISDRERKENFDVIKPEVVLDKLLSMPLSTWNYKFEDKKIRHIGPMAQDFIATFEVGSTDKAIYTVDADGVAFASIKALNNKIETLESDNAALKSTLKAMRLRLDALEK